MTAMTIPSEEIDPADPAVSESTKQSSEGTRNNEPVSERDEHGATAFLRRLLIVVLVVGIPLALIIGIPRYAWIKSPEKQLALRVLDKTVPFTDRREHRGLFWILGQNKIVDPNVSEQERYYNYETGYFGAYPKKREGLTDVSLLSFGDLVNYDLLYIADTYGVYVDDYDTADDSANQLGLVSRDNAHTDFSTPLFGGLDEQEVLAIENFTSMGGQLVAEFNCFASPTPADLRHRMENVLGVSWTGWAGRYCTDFSDQEDVPTWFCDLYLEREGVDLRKTGGSGYIFVEDGLERLVLLWENDDIKPTAVEFVPRSEFAGGDVMSGVSASPYFYWLDVVEPQAGTEVLADYVFQVTESGQARLDQNGIPATMPAVLRRKSNYVSYYLAGDMCEFDKPMGPADTRLTLFMSQRYFSEPISGSNGRFFWHSYYPMIMNILDQALADKD